MQTTKLCSTISYNTAPFLEGTLRRLCESGLLEFAHWVFHQAEEDETKPHFHVVLKPNRRLDTEALRREFRELQLGTSKPLGVQPFKSSKMEDWILYGAHDIAYLLKKGQTRKYHYSKEEFGTTEPDLFEHDWNDAHQAEGGTVRLLEEFSKEFKPWEEICHHVPINQFFQYRELYLALLRRHTTRNGRSGHEECGSGDSTRNPERRDEQNSQ